MQIKNSVIYILSTWLILCTCSASEKTPLNSPEASRPNIVLIVSDDHGSTDLGCYGNPTIKTPNLDQLAENGVRFTNAFCTSASCSPSRSVILTGMYSHATGAYGLSHATHHFAAYDQVQSLPVLLQQLGGYRTARVGKYHLAPEEVFYFEEKIPGHSRNGVEMANNARSFISKKTDQPFFLYFCTTDPHRSGKSKGPDQVNLFGNEGKPYKGIQTAAFSPDKVLVPPYLPDNSQTRQELAEYYQSVDRLDQGIGQLVKVLKEEGAWENTIVMYLSDNGIAFPGAKTSLYQAGIQLPLLVKNTNNENAGTKVDAYVSWVDITPTILDAVGLLDSANAQIQGVYEKNAAKWDNITVPTFQGQSFKSALLGEQRYSSKEVYAAHNSHEITMYYPMRAVIEGQYKLIWNIAHQLPYPQAQDLWSSATWQTALKSTTKQYGVRTMDAYKHRPAFELYDLKQDPDERNNLAELPEMSPTLEKLKGKLKAFQERTNDPWIVKWERE